MGLHRGTCGAAFPSGSLRYRFSGPTSCFLSYFVLKVSSDRWRYVMHLPRLTTDARGVAASLLLALLAGSSLACDPPPPDWPVDLASGPKLNDQTQPVIAANDLIFYIDGSQSMKGYLRSQVPARGSAAQNSGSTIYSRTLEGIHDVATRLQSTNVHVRRVDSQVGRLEDGLILEKAVSSQEFYSGSSTNLEAAIEEFAKPLSAKTVGPAGSETPAPPALFHILVTDGVQSDRGGVDPTRFKESLKHLLESGWAGYVLGVRSQFAGSIWSEKRQGTRIEWESGDDTTRFRPFYVFVFSPDPVRLTAFAGELRTAVEQVAKAAGGGDAASLVREIHLGGEFVRGQARGGLEVGAASSKLLQAAPSEQDPVRLTLRVDESSDRYGPQELTVSFDGVEWTRYAQDCLIGEDIGALVEMTLTPVLLQDGADRYAHPVLSFSGPPGVETDSLSLKMKVDWPASGEEKRWGIYRIEVRVTNKTLQSRPVPGWVVQWSTDDDGLSSIDHCTKTYKLARALDVVWSSAKPDSRTLATAYLRVGPY